MATNKLAIVEAEETAPAPITRDEWTQARIDFIRQHFCGGAPEKEAALFIQLARQMGLSPERRQIYLIGRNNKSGGKTWSIQTGIDGYRSTAAKTGDYAGSDSAVFEWSDQPTTFGKRIPRTATVTVYRFVHGVRCPFSASAIWDEYNAGVNQWLSMPSVMLAKCAEAQALRKAFPDELSGLYTDDEMSQAGEGQRVQPSVQISDGASIDTATGEILEQQAVEGSQEVVVDDDRVYDRAAVAADQADNATLVGHFIDVIITVESVDELETLKGDIQRDKQLSGKDKFELLKEVRSRQSQLVGR